MTKILPDIEYLRKIIVYDPDTGLLFWRERNSSMFREVTGRGRDHSANIWNSANAGKEALRAINGQGYKVGNIDGSMYRSHRVAYALHHGFDPVDQIDHINGDRKDNRISNLRMVTNSQNGKNQKLRKTNTSGYNGVSFCKIRKMWVARAVVDGVDCRIGYFAKKEDANLARLKFNKGNGFHGNHGIERN